MKEPRYQASLANMSTTTVGPVITSANRSAKHKFRNNRFIEVLIDLKFEEKKTLNTFANVLI